MKKKSFVIKMAMPLTSCAVVNATLLACLVYAVLGNNSLHWVNLALQHPDRNDICTCASLPPVVYAHKNKKGEERLILATYDLDTLKSDHFSFANELAEECRTMKYHVVALQNCRADFLEALMERLINDRDFSYRPLHYFRAGKNFRKRKGNVIIFDMKRLSLIDAGRASMDWHTYFTKITLGYNALALNSKAFNLDYTEHDTTKPRHIYGDDALIAYFAFKNSPIRFKVANVNRPGTIKDAYDIKSSISQATLFDKHLNNKYAFGLFDINKYAHLYIRHVLVKMQFFLGQSSCFYDYKFVMGLVGLEREQLAHDSTLKSIFNCGRVRNLDYAGCSEDPDADTSRNPAIFTGAYDSVFYLNTSTHDGYCCKSAWDQLKYLKKHHSVIMHTRGTRVLGLLSYKSDAVSKRRKNVKTRFTTEAAQEVDSWGSTYLLSPRVSNYAYSKNYRSLLTSYNIDLASYLPKLSTRDLFRLHTRFVL